jgi:hypothetical protein
LCGFISAKEQSDSTKHRNNIKLDFVPLYNVFFDSQIQIRGGFEYERILNPKLSFTDYVDAGLFNLYDFYKYYDFFNEHQGMYYTKQHVSITGFHELPGLNYKLYQFKKRTRWSVFMGAMADFSYYQKHFSDYNSKTGETSNNICHQTRIGIGVGVGVKFKISKRFFAEAKTSFFTSLYSHINKDNVNPMEAFDAQWTSPDYKFWSVSNIKIAYAF